MTHSSHPSNHTARLGRRVLNAALGLAVLLLPAIVATPTAQAQSFTLLHTFSGAPDGVGPAAALIRDAAGNLYGTTQGGGNSCGFQGKATCGIVFKIDPSGAETVLYRFTGGADGSNPSAALVRDAAGNLYGTTTGNATSGLGTIFKLDTTNKLTVLHNVGSHAGLAMDGAGKLYGTTTEGIFQLDPVTGTFTVLDSTAGSGATLTLDPAGNIYGTTAVGGITGGACGNSGCGTVFKLDTTLTYSVLYSFTGQGNDGLNPLGGVILDAAGNLWGTTSNGGALDCTGGQHNAIGCGTVFKVSPAGGEISGFSLNGPDFPQAGLALDAAGTFYGTSTFDSSAEGLGEVFKIGRDGIQSPLHIFTGLADGQSPLAGVVLDAAGNVYGTTPTGGPSSFGTVFKIDPSGPQTFPLTVVIFGTGTVAGSGVNCSSNCATWVSTGSAFTLTATPPAGASFVGWVAPPCSGTGTCSVTINAAQTVGATFDSDFTVSATALSPAAVSAGGSATSTINVAADANGFFSAVTLTCAVTPTTTRAPTCSISPASVMPGSPARLTVSTTAPTPAALASNRGTGLFLALCLPIIGLVATRVGLGPDRRTAKRKLSAATLACILFAGLVFQVACGSSNSTGGNRGGNQGTPAGTYTITVTGTYSTGSLVHTAPTTLTVQ